MPTEDALRWNKKYREAPPDWFRSPRSFLVTHLDLLPASGVALDVAMGAGQNAALLVGRGWQVLGIDIATAGVLHAKRTVPELQAVIADLHGFYLPSSRFDLVMNFYYLQRSLFADFARVLRPGGMLVIETLTVDMLALKPETDRRYLLEKGELHEAFKDWEILVYREGWAVSDHGHQKAVASLIARLPLTVQNRENGNQYHGR